MRRLRHRHRLPHVLLFFLLLSTSLPFAISTSTTSSSSSSTSYSSLLSPLKSLYSTAKKHVARATTFVTGALYLHEFTAEGHIEYHDVPGLKATFKVYSRVSLEDDEADATKSKLKSWELEGELLSDLPGTEGKTFTYYKGGKVLGGEVRAEDGKFVIRSCETFKSGQFLKSTLTMPVKVDDPKPLPEVRCADCEVWKAELYNLMVLIVSKRGAVKELHSTRGVVFVDHFYKAQRKYAVPAHVDPGHCSINEQAKAQGAYTLDMEHNPFGYLPGWVGVSGVLESARLKLTEAALMVDKDGRLSAPQAEDVSKFRFHIGADDQGLDDRLAAPASSTVAPDKDATSDEQIMQPTLDLIPWNRDHSPDADVERPPDSLIAKFRHANVALGPQDRVALIDEDEATSEPLSPVELELNSRSTAELLATGSCPAKWKGDGYCDAACNDEANNHDNGDCCPGTCVSTDYACGSNGFDCKGQAKGLKPCLFLHGMGVEGTHPGVVGSKQPPGSGKWVGVVDYWGNMKRELQGICSAVVYDVSDTVDYGWDNKALQTFYYSEALKVIERGGVVFAHSMANNILAGACMDQGLCSVRYYGIQGPYRGSKAANRNKQVSALFRTNPGVAASKLVYTYRGLREGATQRDELGSTVYANRLLKGAACGFDAWGSGHRTGAALWAARDLTWGTYYCKSRGLLGVCTEWGTVEADGFVHMHECARFGFTDAAGNRKYWHIGDQPFTRSSSSPWFRTRANHQDGTGVHGDFDGIISWIKFCARRG